MSRSKSRLVNANKNTVLYLVGLIILALVFATIFYMVITVTPKYSRLEKKSLQGYSYNTFEGWKQLSTSAGTVYTMQYNDYIFDGSSNSNVQKNDLYAQHIVTVEQKAIPTSALTLNTKAQLKTELSKTDGKLFDSLKQSIQGCGLLQDPTIIVDDSPSRNSFLGANFNFYCIQADGRARIHAIGKVIFADDGSALTTIILAADAVFNKNEKTFRSVLDSVQKL